MSNPARTRRRAAGALATALLALAALGGPALAQSAEADGASVAREAAGDDIRQDGPGKSPTQPATDAHGGHHGDPSEHFNFFGSPFEHVGKDVAGGPYGDGVNLDPQTGNTVAGGEEPMSAPFIFAILNFAVLLWLLGKYGGPAARKAAAERHDQIKTALDEAARLRKQAADKLAEYEAKLKAADQEIAALVEGMRADAEADKQRILEAAERQAAQMKRDAEARIAAEIEAARVALTREVTAAAAAATERILREQLTATDQQRLVGAFIGDVQKSARKEAR